MHPKNHVARSNVDQTLQVRLSLLERVSRGCEMTGPVLELAENDMACADALEIIHLVRPALDLVFLDCKGLARPGDCLVEGAVLQARGSQVAVARTEVAQESARRGSSAGVVATRRFSQGRRLGQRARSFVAPARCAQRMDRLLSDDACLSITSRSRGASRKSTSPIATDAR